MINSNISNQLNYNMRPDDIIISLYTIITNKPMIYRQPYNVDSTRQEQIHQMSCQKCILSCLFIMLVNQDVLTKNVFNLPFQVIRKGPVVCMKADHHGHKDLQLPNLNIDEYYDHCFIPAILTIGQYQPKNRVFIV